MKTSLPTRAGKATLQFAEANALPRRGADTLHLPLRENMEFHELKQGEQFLLHLPAGNPRDSLSFFGGWDESPFISRIAPPALKAFIDAGEKGFYEALKPEAIKILSAKYPQAQVKRQGDVWTIALPNTLKVPEAQFSGKQNKRWKRNRTTRVLDTDNHFLEGYYLGRVILPIGDGVRVAIAKGILSAPDHANLNLLVVHALVRTPHLIRGMGGFGWDPGH